ncbi:MAG TPA: GcrA family cell cycle regulator [Xanthobacteraceae bacterium]|nr:GcrA family cell cycle regulator [Xanthobacteraceae bacterium]
MTIATWTEERVERLRSYVNAGLSCSQIAGEIGMTRNAIIGKIHRLGLARERPQAASARLRPRRIPRPPQLPRVAFKQDEAPCVFETPAVELQPATSSRRCSLLALTESACRWPLDDPGTADFAFCGNDAVAGFSYCAAHARMAYRLPERRRA